MCHSNKIEPTRMVNNLHSGTQVTDRLIKEEACDICGTAKITRQGSMFGINLLKARQEISKHILFPMIFALEYIYILPRCVLQHTYRQDIILCTPGVHYVQIPHCRPIYV